MAALALFTLEARDTMVKMLPEVLLDLSKISDTALIACPMLEFLSSKYTLTYIFLGNRDGCSGTAGLLHWSIGTG